MSVPNFISIMSNGDIWFSNRADFTPSGTLVTTIRVNSDALPQKIGTITGSGNSSASALACSAGTGASGSKYTQKEIT